MPFAHLDTTAIARSLSQIADRPADLADVFFERREETELPEGDVAPGIRVCREEGFAVRLLREGRTFLAARDRIDSRLFADALRQVARVMPSAPYQEPALTIGASPPIDTPPELFDFPRRLTRAIRERLAAFPMRLCMRRHRRWIRVVGTQLAPEPQAEEFCSCEVEMPWGSHGMLLPELSDAAVERLADSLTGLFRAQEAPSPDPGLYPVVLGPAASAVLLHEVVAHALETDTLVLSGRVEAALGMEIGARLVNVLDDPTGAPAGVRRSTDDEGMLVIRRWLLREGVLVQPLADMFSAHCSRKLLPGAGRRGSRHEPPVPRSTHLELVPGESTLDELLSGIQGGMFFPEVSRGTLDPLSGRFTLQIPYGRRVGKGGLADLTGPCILRGGASDLLCAVTGVGNEAIVAGAGWCAKGGVKLPVWATAPPVRLERVEVAR